MHLIGGEFVKGMHLVNFRRSGEKIGLNDWIRTTPLNSLEV